MFEYLCLISRRAGAIAAVAGLLAATAYAKPAESSKADTVGRINFEEASLPPANVELDLSQGMFGDLFGIGDAAVAGVAETLMKASKGSDGEGTRMAAEKLAAARQIVALAGNVVREVRVRAYEKAPEDLSSRFDQQLGDGNWEKIVLLRKDDKNIRVSLARRDDAIRGAFIIASDHGRLLLVNVVCNISPENVKKLTSAATKIGLDSGLQHVIEMKFRKMHGPMAPPPLPQTPATPRPPRPPLLPKRDAE